MTARDLTARLLGVAMLMLAACGHEDAPRYDGDASGATATYGQCVFCHDGVGNHMFETGGHSGLEIKCEQCHADQMPGEVGPGHRRVPACTDCHSQQAAHAPVASGGCVACHTPHGSSNLDLIREMIEVPQGGTRPITFTNRTGLADGSYASLTTPGTGLCESCHTGTTYYRADAMGQAHFTSSCIGCHEHAEGFIPPPAPDTPTFSPTRTPSSTRTNTPTDTPVPTDSPTVTLTPTPTGPSPTPTATPTGPSPTPTITPTFTDSPSPTPTNTPVVLRATRVAQAPTGIDDPLWNTVAPLQPTLGDVSTGLLYADGQLNMTGTFGGLGDFNDGEPANLELRAVHDGSKLYVLARWNDRTLDPDRERWLFNGPADPLKASESATGWTSQRNDDQVALAFEIESASSERGSFANVGCAAACHNSAQAGGLDMRPQQGSVDLWSWKTARSEPLGYADDAVSRADSGRASDAGTRLESRNIATAGNNRSGPAVEWDGTTQNVTRGDGAAITLDPAYFIADGHRTAFAGDAAAGDPIYQSRCAGCHGAQGQGGIGPALGTPEIARTSRAGLDAASAAASHPGASSYNALTATEKTNVLARLRGFSGIPGTILAQPAGSAADLTTQSNVAVTTVDTLERTDYRVLIIRSLQTGNADDVQFTAGNQYPFGIALMDGDGRNHIGSQKEILAIDP